MGYQALLFCPDEKTARSVTQVLSELEFSVEPCSETFAAVKKLMAAHFDAIVVDCDNEQNATLLFKSARNSASNQASLAVAVVEGQAGVAKAFRIGANLVLTKPINIEQAKGTLRVARGLLRKSEAAKSGAAAAAAATAAAAPAKPAVSSPVPPVPPAASASRPSMTPAAKPSWPGPAAAPSAPPALEQEPPVTKSSSLGISKPPAPVAPQVPAKPAAPAPAPPRLAAPAASALPAPAKPLPKPAATASASFSSGAASAPPPAREAQPVPRLEASPAEVSPAHSTKAADDLFEKPAPAAPESASPAYEAPAPSFTFGGNATAESTGSKKILFGIVAVVLLAVGLYFGWTYIGHGAQPVNNPGPNPQPSSGRPPLTSVPAPAPALSRPVPPAAAQPKSTVADNTKPAPDSDTSSDSYTETPSSPAASSGKAAAEAKPAAAPLVVKGGTMRGVTAKPAVPDAPAPSVIGIAAPSAGGPPADLVASSSAARPVLQRLKVSQGVSQGLLIKKVTPVYPADALRVRIEGTVQLLATVSKTGDVTDLKVLSGDPQFTPAAIAAVKRWKYKPYLLSDEPVDIQTEITINFTLPH